MLIAICNQLIPKVFLIVIEPAEIEYCGKPHTDYVVLVFVRQFTVQFYANTATKNCKLW
ncbi:hypothetical protein ACVBKF_15015 [Shewanella sp. 0m-11]